MNPDHGVWYGVTFDAVLFGGMGLFFWVQHRFERARWEMKHPRVQGSSSRLLSRLRRLARPTLLLGPATGTAFSKLGGDPELPKDASWPLGRSSTPRTFLVQIDLGTLKAHALEWLPSEGRCYAFYDPEAHGEADVVQIIYSRDAAGPPNSTPPGSPRHPEQRVSFLPFTSVPSSEWLNSHERLDLDIEEVERRIESVGDQPPEDCVQHRIGGYPDEIQNGCLRLECEYLSRGLAGPDYKSAIPPAIERASKAWRLLLQIDSDPALGMEFGDAGRLYVFIRERHARAADFSKTVTIFQGY